MRIHAGLLKQFWADVMNTATYLINRGPSIPLHGGLPEEAWTGKEVNLTHLRIFGCTSYAHINSVDRTKLDPKSLKCTFIWYGANDFGYRFWDIIFNVSVIYMDMMKQQTGKSEETEYVELEKILIKLPLLKMKIQRQMKIHNQNLKLHF